MNGEIIIGVHGAARSGKDSAADHLGSKFGLVKVEFARPLKRAISALLGIEEAKLEKSKESPVPMVETSPRALYQEVGEACRRLNPDFFTCLAGWAMVQARIQADDQGAYLPGFVFSDIRYENEAEWVRSMGGRVLHIQRDDAPAVREHSSEAGIAVSDGDLIIPNNGTMDELFARLDGVVFADDQ